jgi:hypothetical protein
MISKIKNFFKSRLAGGQAYEKDLILAVVIILVALISFGLGRLSKIGESRVPITIENLSTTTPTEKITDNKIMGNFVASKNGTKYHYPWCSGAQSIKEENKIWFSTAEEAQKAGYEPASNCKGLK